MFVTVITPHVERRFDCDEVEITHLLAQDPLLKENPDSVFVVIYKNGVRVKEIEVQKIDGNSIFFMNDKGQTVDTASWDVHST